MCIPLILKGKKFFGQKKKYWGISMKSSNKKKNKETKFFFVRFNSKCTNKKN
jgi:hypothetical protein